LKHLSEFEGFFQRILKGCTTKNGYSIRQSVKVTGGGLAQIVCDLFIGQEHKSETPEFLPSLNNPRNSGESKNCEVYVERFIFDDLRKSLYYLVRKFFHWFFGFFERRANPI